MRIDQLFLESTDARHVRASGSIVMAEDTQRFLLAHRADAAYAKQYAHGRYDWRDHIPNQPGTWSTFGGKIKGDEDSDEAACRELAEETGYHGHLIMIPLSTYRSDTLNYSNFLAICEKEFRPILNSETKGYRWCEFGDWPKPLHFGLVAILNDAASMATINKYIE